MSDKTPVKDRRERDLIKTALDKNILVEAGAGAGKTDSLVDRMVALIAHGKCDVEHIVAVTFTRKSAGELQARFQLRLEQSCKSEPDETKRERLLKALQHIERCFIGTIHSFCAKLLREHPVGAKLDPDFVELEDMDNEFLCRKCWNEYLELLRLNDEDDLLARLGELGIDVRDLYGVYGTVCVFPEVEIEKKEIPAPDFQIVIKEIKKYLALTKNAAGFVEPQGGWDGLQRAIRQAHRLSAPEFGWEHKPAATMRLVNVLGKNIDVSQKRCWSDKETCAAEIARLQQLQENFINPAIEYWNKYCHYYIMKLVGGAAKYFKDTRLKHSSLNFTDLLILARDLLYDAPDIRKNFQERYKYILVDEFQDTDPIQAEILFYLVGKDTTVRDWTKIEPVPGSLFVVGDPKQSIYRFRRADIDIYKKVKNIIAASGGEILELKTIFRSVPGICNWVNPIFQNKFGAGSPYQAEYKELWHYREDVAGCDPAVSPVPAIRKIVVPKQTRHNKKDIMRYDALQIANWIKSAIGGQLMLVDKETEQLRAAAPGDFMILVNKIDEFHDYASALELFGIPFETAGDKSFKDSDGWKSLRQLVHTLADPEDTIKIIAVLRGPLFGISDDILYQYKQSGGQFSYFIKNPDDRHDLPYYPVIAALNQLNRWHHLIKTFPLAVALEIIIDETGIIPFEYTKEDGKAGTILKLLEYVRNLSGRAELSFLDLIERLEFVVDGGDIQSMSINPVSRQGVRILNLHKAKGLEERVVFLAAPVKQGKYEPAFHIARAIDEQSGREKAAGFFVASAKKDDWHSTVIGVHPDWDKVKDTESSYLDAEKDRLLYVAATRACDILVVSMYNPEPEKKTDRKSKPKPQEEDAGAATPFFWGDFYPYIKDARQIAQEVKLPEIQPEPQANIEDEMTGYQLLKEQIGARVNKMIIPSYFEKTASSLVKGHSIFPREDGTASAESAGADDVRGGLAFGRVIHKLLELSVLYPDMDLKPAIQFLLADEELPDSQTDSVERLIQSVLTSSFWVRVRRAKRKFAEIPFSVRYEDKQSAGQEGLPVKTLLAGAIDLVFEERGGWVIVDYKTDRSENIGELVEFYKPQVSAYREFWANYTGQPVRETLLYFVQSGKIVKVN